MNHSDWDCTLEPGEKGIAVRLGTRMVKGIQEPWGRSLETARARRPFVSIGDLARRTRVPRHALTRLALTGALVSLARGRREALWEIQALGPLDEDDLFFGVPMDGTEVPLPKMSAAERVSADWSGVGVSLEHHPLALLRNRLKREGAVTAAELSRGRAGKPVIVGGLRICLQRPPTAKGIAFLSLEDETGIANLVVMPDLVERYRRELLGSLFLIAEGRLEKSGKVVNVKVHHVRTLSFEDVRAMNAAPTARPAAAPR